MRRIYHGPFKLLFTITPDKGADQLVWLAEGRPGSTFTPGAYYESRKIATKVHPLAGDAATAAHLWDRSAALVGALA